MHLENLKSTKIHEGKIKQDLPTILPLIATANNYFPGGFFYANVYIIYFLEYWEHTI